VRGDGRRRADDARVDGPAQRLPRTSSSGAAGRRGLSALCGATPPACRPSAESASLPGGAALALRGARKGGSAQKIVAARSIQYVLRRFSGSLPRLGLLTETCQLLETAHTMEMSHPVGPGGVTEFDRVFEIACNAATQCLAVSSADWQDSSRKTPGKKKERGRRRVLETRRPLAKLSPDNLLRPLPPRRRVSPARPTPR